MVIEKEKGRIGRIGRGVGVVGVEAGVGQTLVGVGMGMTGGSPRMIDGTEASMNQIIGLEKVVTVRGETVVVAVANRGHIDISRRVALRLAERARNLAEGRDRHDTRQAPVLRPHPSGKRAIEGTRGEGTPVPGQVR